MSEKSSGENGQVTPSQVGQGQEEGAAENSLNVVDPDSVLTDQDFAAEWSVFLNSPSAYTIAGGGGGGK